MADKNPMEMTSAETDEFFEAATEGIKTAEAAGLAPNDNSPADERNPMQQEPSAEAEANGEARENEPEPETEVADPELVGAPRALPVFVECHPDPDWDALFKWQWFCRPNKPAGFEGPLMFVNKCKPDHEFPPHEGRTRADWLLGDQRDLAVEAEHIDERSRIAYGANQRLLFWNVRAYVFEIGRVVKLKGLSPLGPASVYLDPMLDAEGRPTRAPYLTRTMHLRDAYSNLMMPLELPLGFLVKTANDGYWPLERVFIIGGEFEPQTQMTKTVAKERPKESSADTSEKTAPSGRESPKPGTSGLVPAEMPPHLLRLRDLEESFARDAPRREELRRQAERHDHRKPYGQRPRQRPAYRDYNGSHSSHGRVSKPEGSFKGPQPRRTFVNSEAS